MSRGNLGWDLGRTPGASSDPITSTRRMSSAEMSSTFCSTCSTSRVSSSTSTLPRYATPSPLGVDRGRGQHPGVRPRHLSARSGSRRDWAKQFWRRFGGGEQHQEGSASEESRGKAPGKAAGSG